MLTPEAGAGSDSEILPAVLVGSLWCLCLVGPNQKLQRAPALSARRAYRAAIVSLQVTMSWAWPPVASRPSNEKGALF